MKKYKLFTNCFVTDGYTKYLILDCQRGKMFSISKELGKYLKNNDFIDFDFFGRNELKFYKDFLNQHELIFDFTDLNLEEFPNLNLDFKNPSKIYTIEVNSDDVFYLDKKIYTHFLVQHIVITISNNYLNFVIEFNQKMQDFFSESPINYFSVIIDYEEFLKVKELLLLNKRILKIKVRNSPNELIDENIIYLTDNSDFKEIIPFR